MPGDYRYLDESTLVASTYWGTISLVDILETITHRAGDLAEHHPKASVVDLSAAKWHETPPKFMHHQIERLRPALAPPKVRTVLIAPSDFFYGFARMYAIMHNVYGAANVEVARSWADAALLLGMDLSSAESWSRERVAQEEAAETQDTIRMPKP
ncbi:MAG TPA: hypothetical protein VL503_11660 [Candidatus Omnitrophota bacterium]|jgi:hypothetical protein|nr:hypothetical protein [Candidatus Omnitrophota bacterium]